MTTTAPAPGSQNANGTYNWTQAVWAAEVLVKLSEASGNRSSDNFVTLNNIQNVERWMAAECSPGSNCVWYHNNNPLNINASGTGSDTYKSLDEGSSKTAQLIYDHYPGILTVLRQNGSTQAFSAAVVKSPWAESHYGVAAAGAPPQWIEPGRGLDYIATVPVPDPVNTKGGAASSINVPNPTGVAGQLKNSAPNPFSAFTDLVPGLGTFLTFITTSSNWIRLGEGLLGAALLVGGLILFVSTTGTGKKIEGAAGQAAELAPLAAA